MRDGLMIVARLYRVTTVVGFCGLLLSGCGNKEQAASSSGQVVAHVGNSVVTTQELDNEIRLANVPADRSKDPALVKQILNELVVRKYLAQQAVEAKFDREPTVLLNIMRARDLVLATDFLNHTVDAKPITQDEVEKYIANNPLKFANRQAVAVEQIVMPLGPSSQAAVDAVKDVNSLVEVDQKLTEMGIVHSRSPGTLSSGDVPAELFNLMQAKKDSNVFFVRSGPNGVFFKVTGETTRPLEGVAAESVARRLIRADRVKAQSGIAAVSASLDAKYEGDYAALMKKDENPADKKQ